MLSDDDMIRIEKLSQRYRCAMSSRHVARCAPLVCTGLTAA